MKVKLGEVVQITSTNMLAHPERNWLLNLDMVEQQTGNIIEYKYVAISELGGSIISFDTDIVLYSKLRPNLNKVVVPQITGYATSEMLPLKPNEKYLTREYLAAFLRSDSFVTWAVSKTAGAKMPRLGTKELLGKEIYLPSLENQRNIVAVLDKVSDLIAMRKKQLQKLDDLVKSRFVEMFGGIDPSEYKTMAELCSIITDGTHQPPKFVSDGIPFLFVSNITSNVLTYNAEKFIDEQTYAELIKRTPIEIGDILLSTVGSYGHPAVVKELTRFCFQRHIAYLKPKLDVVNSEYLHGAILSPIVQPQIEEKVKGIAQKTLNLSEIRTIKLPVPDMALQCEYAQFAAQTAKSKSTIQQSLDKLELLKKALMQKYFG